MNEESEIKITSRSWVPLGKAVAIGFGLFSGGFVVAQAIGKMEVRLEAIETANSRIWTVSDMERWAYLLEKNNRDTKLWVPDAREVKQSTPKS